MNDSVFESIVGPDPPPLALEPLRPWEVRKTRASLEEAEGTPQPKSAEGRAALANVVQACRAALAEYETCSPLARLRRSPRRFDAMVEHRAQAIEDAYTEADWPPSQSAVQDALDVLVEEACVETDGGPPSRTAAQDAPRDVTQSELKPKGPENLSPMQMAVLGIVLEFGGTPDEIADRLSAEYERPPTRQSVIDAYEGRLRKTGRVPGPQGGRRPPRGDRRARRP